MKFNGYKCDACGRFYEKNEEKDKNGIPVTGIGLLNTKLGVTRYDLCDDCIKRVLGTLYPANARGDVFV